jgi:hypothetical protein
VPSWTEGNRDSEEEVRRPILALFTLFALSGFSQEGIYIHNGFLRAEEYMHMNVQSQHDYAMGVVDGMFLAPLFGAPRAWQDGQKIGAFGECITGMSSTQVAAIVSKFTREHPERWNESMHAVAFTAMTQACSQK